MINLFMDSEKYDNNNFISRRRFWNMSDDERHEYEDHNDYLNGLTHRYLVMVCVLLH